jgi:hypothetical protein
MRCGRRLPTASPRLTSIPNLIKGDVAQVKAQFIGLLELLVRKGVITEEEKKDLLREKGTS